MEDFDTFLHEFPRVVNDSSGTYLVLHIPDPHAPLPDLSDCGETATVPSLCGTATGTIGAYLADDGLYYIDEDFCTDCAVVYLAGQAIEERLSDGLQASIEEDEDDE